MSHSWKQLEQFEVFDHYSTTFNIHVSYDQTYDDIYLQSPANLVTDYQNQVSKCHPLANPDQHDYPTQLH